LSNRDNGQRTSWRHWSRREWFAISICSSAASEMYGRNDGALCASCTAILVKILPAWPTSPPPLEKKKLAPRRFCSKYLRATVRAIVDFPVPAKPLSQKIHCSSSLSTQLYISSRRPTRVFGRQVGESCFANELNGASSAYGRRWNTSESSPSFPISTSVYKGDVTLKEKSIYPLNSY
jgi:hypothetical protein